MTQDLERLSAFYRDVLGFACDGPVQAITAAELSLLRVAGRGRSRQLQLGNQRLTLQQFDQPGRPYPADGNAAALWFQHLALVVTDIGSAYAALRNITPLSDGGPQHLPASSGGVDAFKFRDPDGHPLELLQFPPDQIPPAWQGKGSALLLGIDHSAISVSDAQASAGFYTGLGLATGKRSLNQGAEQQRLDGLRDVEVDVVPMLPPGRHGDTTPHLELLGYRTPPGQAGTVLRANDVAATRIVWRGERMGLIADPDGHLHQVEG